MNTPTKQQEIEAAEARFRKAHEALGAAKSRVMRLTSELAEASDARDAAVDEVAASEGGLATAYMLPADHGTRPPSNGADDRPDGIERSVEA